MNERIRELAEQAGSTHKQSLGVYQFYNHELEKFAELIVSDCIRIMEHAYENKLRLSDAIWNTKIHFEVE
jgi:hypothetical protein